MATTSYAGISFNSPDAGLTEWLQAKYSLDQARTTVGQRVSPSPTLQGIANPLHNIHRPRLRVGEFFYPSGCSRWAEYTGVATTDAALQMFAAAFPNGSAVPKPFIMTVNGKGVQTNLYMLPPKPLNAFSTLGMFLITLVDERYFATPTEQQVWNSGAVTWSSYFQGLATGLGITLTYSAIDAVYGIPDLDSDLAYAPLENAWLILESAAAMVGRTVCRNWNGTYELLTADEASAVKDENLASVDSALAGGDVFGEGATPTAAFGILPGSVSVSFPKVMKGSWYSQPITTHLPSPINASPYVYVKDIGISDVEGYSGITGTDDSKAFRNTAKAIYTDITSSTPDNQANLDALALQIAQDYYDFHFSGLDIVLLSIVDWEPDGLHDLIFTNNSEKCQTRVQCKPLNYDIDQMCHSTDGNPMPFLEPGCWGVITGIASSPDSTGYHPCSWIQQDPNKNLTPPWQNTANGIVATLTQNQAYEDNDQVGSLVIGERAWMRVGDNGTYRFSAGGGGVSTIGITGCDLPIFFARITSVLQTGTDVSYGYNEQTATYVSGDEGWADKPGGLTNSNWLPAVYVSQNTITTTPILTPGNVVLMWPAPNCLWYEAIPLSLAIQIKDQLGGNYGGVNVVTLLDPLSVRQDPNNTAGVLISGGGNSGTYTRVKSVSCQNNNLVVTTESESFISGILTAVN
jgi:hypothetical protein